MSSDRFIYCLYIKDNIYKIGSSINPNKRAFELRGTRDCIEWALPAVGGFQTERSIHKFLKSNFPEKMMRNRRNRLGIECYYLGYGEMWSLMYYVDILNIKDFKNGNYVDNINSWWTGYKSAREDDLRYFYKDQPVT